MGYFHSSVAELEYKLRLGVINYALCSRYYVLYYCSVAYRAPAVALRTDGTCSMETNF